MVHCLVLSMQQKVFYQINGCHYKAKNIIGNQRQTATHRPTSHKCFCVRQKLQTIRETTFDMRGNIKPFGKRLSPCTDTPNHVRMSCGRPARDINKKSTLKKWIFKVLCKRRRLPTLPHCIAYHQRWQLGHCYTIISASLFGIHTSATFLPVLSLPSLVFFTSEVISPS